MIPSSTALPRNQIITSASFKCYLHPYSSSLLKSSNRKLNLWGGKKWRKKKRRAEKGGKKGSRRGRGGRAGEKQPPSLSFNIIFSQIPITGPLSKSYPKLVTLDLFLALYLQFQTVLLFLRNLILQCLLLFQQVLQWQSWPIQLQFFTPCLKLQRHRINRSKDNFHHFTPAKVQAESQPPFN